MKEILVLSQLKVLADSCAIYERERNFLIPVKQDGYRQMISRPKMLVTDLSAVLDGSPHSKMQ